MTSKLRQRIAARCPGVDGTVRSARMRIGVALALGAALTLAGCTTPTSTGRAGSSVSPTTPTTSSSSPAPASSGGSSTSEKPFQNRLIGFGFSDTKDGLLVIRQCSSSGCALAAEGTSDGGRHWEVRGDLPRVGTRGQVLVLSRRSAVVTIQLRNGSSRAYRTDDGGRTWQRMHMPADLRPISVVGDHLWGVSNNCAGMSDLQCSVTVWSAPISGDRFTRIAKPTTNRQPAVTSATVGDSTIFLQVGQLAPAASDRLLVSTDAGHSWSAAPSPCPKLRANLAGAQGSGSRVWALCTGEPSAGQMRKRLFVSSDAGTTWTREPSPSSSGYSTTLTVTSPTTAWLYGNGRADVFRTTDSGNAWHDLLKGKVGESAGGGVYWLDPLDSRHAWVIGTQPGDLSHGLLRITSNGGRTWKTITLTL